ncbi:MAG: hypothetical protein IT462_04770 [Planctomycetes bacterium]|nr:hypothetical protein [Planctomycetota bacterium]
MGVLRRFLRSGHPLIGGAMILLAVGATALLFIEGAGPGVAALPVVPKQAPGSDKFWHFLAHFCVTLLLFCGGLLWRRRPRHSRRWPLATLAFAVDFAGGLTVELVQMFAGAAHGRRFEYGDLAANASGALAAVAIGVALWTIIVPPRSRRG